MPGVMTWFASSLLITYAASLPDCLQWIALWSADDRERQTCREENDHGLVRAACLHVCLLLSSLNFYMCIPERRYIFGLKSTILLPHSFNKFERSFSFHTTNTLTNHLSTSVQRSTHLTESNTQSTRRHGESPLDSLHDVPRPLGLDGPRCANHHTAQQASRVRYHFQYHIPICRISCQPFSGINYPDWHFNSRG